MAAAFFRRRWCINYFHRELCRAVWRPQVALFSSKPWDKKPPRITHFKKAKPQPAVDVAKLLDQLFSQQRPGTAPSAASKAKRASASVISTTKVSDLPQTSSKTNPAASASAAAAASPVNSAPASSPPTELTQDSSSDLPPPAAAVADSHFSAQSIETKVETAAQPLSADMVEETSPAASAEPTTETLIEISVDTSPPLVETVETQASSSAAGSAEPVIDATADAEATENSDSGEIVNLNASSVETSVESATEIIVEAIEAAAPVIEAAVEPLDITIDAAVQKMESSDSEGVLVEPTVESATDIIQSVEAELSTVEGAEHPVIDAKVDPPPHPEGVLEPLVEPSIDVTVEAAAETSIHPQEVSKGIVAAGDASGQLIDITLIETTIEPPVEVALPLEESVETRASAAGSTEAPAGEVRTTRIELGVVSISETPTVEPVTETVEELLVEASAPPVVMVGTATEAAEVEASEPEVVDAAAVEPVAETIEEVLVEASAPLVVTAETATEAAQAEVVETSAAVPESAEETVAAEESEQMNLESVTLHSSKSSIDSLHSDELLQTKFTLDEEVEKRVQELLVDAEPPTPAQSSSGAEQEEEVQDLNQALSQWSSLSEELQELEGETDLLVSELVFQIPAAPLLVKEEVKSTVGEAMTLESLTLSEVEAEVEILESQDLQEASVALEKEADALMVEEKMEVKVATEEEVVFVKEDTAETDISTQDSISEAAEAIEAELPVLMEAMLGSELGLHEPLDTEALQKDAMDQKVENQEVLEAMSLESVTLAEVEASLETLENETLSETATFLEMEAEVLAGDTKVEEVTRSEEEEGEKGEALSMESLSLPEAEDLKTDALMEELLFTVPAAVREVQVQQEEEAEPTAPHALDPIQRLFLEKIREYNALRSSSGGPVEAELQYQQDLSEETAKLQRLYGGGDLNSFPEFTFTEPEMDQDHK